MLKINNDVRVTANDLNMVVEVKKIITDHFLTQKENIGKEKWVTDSFHGTLDSLISNLLEKYELDQTVKSQLNSIFVKFYKANERFKDLNVENKVRYKIIIDKDWYATGYNTNYDLIKRTTIQEHRLTKQENIGKDKYIVVGYIYSVELILRRVLNQKIIEALAEDTEIELSDISNLIDNYDANLKNIIIEKHESVNNSEDNDIMDENKEENVEDDTEDIGENNVEDDVAAEHE